MMYQRAIDCLRASGEREKEADDGAEERIDTEEEERKDQHQDADEDRGLDRLLTGRPDDLARLCLDLIEEFAGRCPALLRLGFAFGHVRRFHLMSVEPEFRVSSGKPGSPS